jgi:hypothetical protein
MRLAMRRSIFVLVAAAWIMGCGQGPVPSHAADVTATQPDVIATRPAATPEPIGTGPIHDGLDGIGFVRPVDWILWRPNDRDPLVGGPVVYLSTAPLKSECAVSRSETPHAMDSGADCSWPLDRLPPGGVFIEWVWDRLLQKMPTKGAPISMAAGATVLVTDRPGFCSAIGGDETVSVAIPMGQPTRLSNRSVIACLRGPDLAAAEARVHALIEGSVEP